MENSSSRAYLFIIGICPTGAANRQEISRNLGSFIDLREAANFSLAFSVLKTRSCSGASRNCICCVPSNFIFGSISLKNFKCVNNALSLFPIRSELTRISLVTTFFKQVLARKEAVDCELLVSISVVSEKWPA